LTGISSPALGRRDRLESSESKENLIGSGGVESLPVGDPAPPAIFEEGRGVVRHRIVSRLERMGLEVDLDEG
jgi:hypothetical protein